jgi:hypothetical protein
MASQCVLDAADGVLDLPALRLELGVTGEVPNPFFDWALRLFGRARHSVMTDAGCP